MVGLNIFPSELAVGYAKKMDSLTVIEYKSFQAQAAKLFPREEVDSLIDYLSQTPRAGEPVSPVDCLRILEWPRSEFGRQPMAKPTHGEGRLLS